MIKDDKEHKVTLERINNFQQQVENLRMTENSAANYCLSTSGFFGKN
ncbi:MAG: hypothetical protein KAV87_61140 [Desulfobacteraceae bacterium]|jgi:hypothetical protein|nr:hypothetical protein [Desulfobacteraceae bacterium]